MPQHPSILGGKCKAVGYVFSSKLSSIVLQRIVTKTVQGFHK